MTFEQKEKLEENLLNFVERVITQKETTTDKELEILPAVVQQLFQLNGIG